MILSVRKLLLLIIPLILVILTGIISFVFFPTKSPQKAYAQTAPSCTHYAAPTVQSSGNHSSQANAGLISTAWSKLSPGSVLCLMDGPYANSNGMIIPPLGLSGTSGNPITVRALNDGQVDIDGGGVRTPVVLNQNNWFILEGFNAHDSSGTVVNIIASSNTIARRIVAWNANGSTNVHIWSIPNSNNILLEDVAGFGSGRKVFSYFQSQGVTYRRAWGRWESSTQIGPKMVFAPVYNDFSASIENGISTWKTSQSSIDQPFGTIAVDRIDGTNRDVFLNILGSISYIEGSDSFQPNSQLFITKVDDVLIKDSIMYFSPSQHTSKQTALLGNCSTSVASRAKKGEFVTCLDHFELLQSPIN